MGLPWIEYVVVASSLLGTLSVGLYCIKSDKGSLEDYMFGGRRMTVWPIALSITATMMSGTMMIGGGQETYLHGTQIMVANAYMAATGLFAAYFYLPILYSLDSVSPYEFFDRRFNGKVRKVISAINVFDTTQLIVMSLFVPALTFSQATGISSFKIACCLSLVCFIYTITGGLKAVAWADSFQMMILVTCTAFFFAFGIIKVGGLSEVWRLNDEGYRIEFFNLQTSISQRTSLLNCSGVIFLWAPYFLSASQHQRYQSLPTHGEAKKAILLSVVLIFFLSTVQYSVGLIAYAYFAGCDPVLAKEDIHSYSTIVPYFISHLAVNYRGMTGLFHADVIAAGLSTTTSLWNTLACTIYDDLIRPFIRPVQEKQAHRIILGLVVIIALVTTLLTRGVEVLGTIVEASVVLRTTTQCAILVLFNAGMFLPWVNSKGVVAGGVTAVLTSMFVVYGNTKNRWTGAVKDYPKFLTTEGCAANISMLTNVTQTYGIQGYGSHTVADDNVFWLFKLSFWYYQVPGFILGIIISVVVSYLTGFQSLETVDSQMIVPQLRWLLPSGKNSKDDRDADAVTETSQEMYILVPQEPVEDEATLPEPNQIGAKS